MRKIATLSLIASAIALGGCDSTPAEPVVAEAPSSLQIGSAKRQCVMTASLSGEIPKDMSQQLCDCSIDKLVEDKHFTASSQPNDQQAETALNGCFDAFVSESELGAKEGSRIAN
jgi:hypothetical protein